MGRPSKLSEAQKEDVRKRLLAGEKASDLAREYKIDRAAITRMFSQQIATIKTVANQIVAADKAFNNLSVTQQIATISHVDLLKSISGHIANAANNGAALANRLSGMAAKYSDKIDDSDLESEESISAIKTVNALMRTANESSGLAIEIIKANKEAMNQPDPNQMKPKTLDEFYGGN
jgi:hypothetical protein